VSGQLPAAPNEVGAPFAFYLPSYSCFENLFAYLFIVHFVIPDGLKLIWKYSRDQS
jgi:hypothetical protein